jgi:DNA-binding phage protein
VASRAGVPRDFLYRFLSDSYDSSPSFEMIARVVHAIGRKLTTLKK